MDQWMTAAHVYPTCTVRWLVLSVGVESLKKWLAPPPWHGVPAFPEFILLITVLIFIFFLRN